MFTREPCLVCRFLNCKTISKWVREVFDFKNAFALLINRIRNDELNCFVCLEFHRSENIIKIKFLRTKETFLFTGVMYSFKKFRRKTGIQRFTEMAFDSLGKICANAIY